VTRGWQPIVQWLDKTTIQNKIFAHVMFVPRNYDLYPKVDIPKAVVTQKPCPIAGPVKLGHNDEFRSVKLGHNDDEFRSETLGQNDVFRSIILGHNDDKFRLETLGQNDEFRSVTLGHNDEF